MIAGQLWTTTLKEIPDEIIDKALEKCVDTHKWPPEISEFKQICLGLKGSSLIPWFDDVIKLSNQSTVKTNQSVERIIDEGAKVCKMLKNIYPEMSWMKIAIKFTELKKKPNFTMKDILI